MQALALGAVLGRRWQGGAVRSGARWGAVRCGATGEDILYNSFGSVIFPGLLVFPFLHFDVFEVKCSCHVFPLFSVQVFFFIFSSVVHLYQLDIA